MNSEAAKIQRPGDARENRILLHVASTVCFSEPRNIFRGGLLFRINHCIGDRAFAADRSYHDR